MMISQLPSQVLQALAADGDHKITKLPGNENENYLVQTSQEKVVVKHLQSLYSVTEIQHEDLYRRRVAEAGLPVAPYMRWSDGQVVLTSHKSRYVALPYVPGIASGHSQQLAVQVAQMLARIHLIKTNNLPERHTWFRENYIADSLENIDERYAEAKQIFATMRKQAPDLWHPGLPQGIVHGDLHNENVIVDRQGKVVSIIDWEETDIEPLLLDVAYTARAMCFRNGVCNGVLFRKFMDAYQSIRPLTKPEKEIFASALQYTALVLSVWAYLKASQGQMDETTLADLGQMYMLDYQVPSVA